MNITKQIISRLRSFLNDLKSVKKIRCDRMRIISTKQVAPHTYHVTSESDRYGRLTQDVVCFPEGLFGDK